MVLSRRGNAKRIKHPDRGAHSLAEQTAGLSKGVVGFADFPACADRPSSGTGKVASHVGADIGRG